MLGKKSSDKTKQALKSNKQSLLSNSPTPNKNEKTKGEYHTAIESLINKPKIKPELEKHIGPVLKIVHPIVLEEIDMKAVATMSEKKLIAHIKPIINRVLDEQQVHLNGQEQAYLETKMLHDMLGLGPLEPLLADSSISDILVNGANNVYIERGGKLELSPARFRDNDHVLNVITRIVSTVGRRIDEQHPLVDTRLQDGSRVNAIIHPLALDGPSISIRKFSQQRLLMHDMVENGSISANMVKMLTAAVKSKLNILVVGGTGAGKTTFLNALSQMIGATDRIITIEDAAELQLQQPHVVRLETRPPNIEGKGEINQTHLVKNALRMRPDRIILGEIRGGEAFDMLQAMNTGHDGSMCTIHASSPEEVPSRLSNMVMMQGYDFPINAILEQIASSVQLLVQVARMRDGKRRITQVTEITGMLEGKITLQDLFKYEYEGEDAEGNLIGEYLCCNNVPNFINRAKLFAQEHLIEEALKT